MSDPWGLDSPPSLLPDPLPPLPPRLTRLAEMAATGAPAHPDEVSFPCTDELPEVQALAPDGWRPLDGAPLHSLLPAAWPDKHRTWIPDRLPRFALRGLTTASYRDSFVLVPDDDLEDDWPYEHIAEMATAAGLPAPPRDRIWLLRSPWPRIPLVAVYELLWSMVEERTPDEPAAMYRAARNVLRWPEDRALAACSARHRSLIEQWAAIDRIGEEVSHYLERDLTPADITRLTDRIGVEEETALAWFDSLCAENIDAAADFVVAWRAAELPGDPPFEAHRFMGRDLAELRRWLDAGYDLYAADKLRHAGLDRTIEWREAGFSAAETYELLWSDPALTLDDARAFADFGLADPDRREWIYYGFAAEQAARWAATGLTPDEARLWRATDHQPSDVGAGQRIPPELIAGRRYIASSQGPNGRRHYAGSDELADPPGTRGRRARRWAHDPDPWINTD